MSSFVWNVFLAFVWAGLLGEVTLATLVEGFLFGLLVLWISPRRPERERYFRRSKQVFLLAGFLLKEIVVASVRIARDVLTFGYKMHPGIVAVPIEVESDEAITFLAAIVTLTPGSMVVDVSDDRRVLFVHGIFVTDPEEMRRRIKAGFERRIREILT